MPLRFGSFVSGIDATFINRLLGRSVDRRLWQSSICNCFVVKVSKAVLQIVTCSHGTYGREGCTLAIGTLTCAVSAAPFPLGEWDMPT
jgi:hypothetical protein